MQAFQITEDLRKGPGPTKPGPIPWVQLWREAMCQDPQWVELYNLP